MINKSRQFRLGNLTFQIEGDFYVPFFNIWSYKIDPYLVEEKGNNLFTISFDEKPYPIEQKLLRCDNFGFYACYITEDQKHTVYYQYKRKSTKETYFTFSVDKTYRKICLLEDNTNSYRAIPFEYLGQIIPHVILNYDFLTFHGVLMEYQHKGIVISAPSGTGKTTHARMWRDMKKALIINGDRAVCQRVGNVWNGIGFPWSGTSGEQINRSVPLKAIVVLERGSENKASLINGLDAFAGVLPHIICPTWDAGLTGRAIDLLNGFLQDIPVIRLQCRPDPESVEVLLKILEELE